MELYKLMNRFVRLVLSNFEMPRVDVINIQKESGTFIRKHIILPFFPSHVFPQPRNSEKVIAL